MRLGAQRARPRGKPAGARRDVLTDLTGFGSNPGALAGAHLYPGSLLDNAPLVVVLHGCTQSAADHAHGSGCHSFAERHGFRLVVPEQQRANNPNLCFNWFVPPRQPPRSAGRGAVDLADGRTAGSRTAGSIAGGCSSPGCRRAGRWSFAMLAAYPDVFARRGDHRRAAIYAACPCPKRSTGCAATAVLAADELAGAGPQRLAPPRFVADRLGVARQRRPHRRAR